VPVKQRSEKKKRKKENSGVSVSGCGGTKCADETTERSACPLAGWLVLVSVAVIFLNSNTAVCGVGQPNSIAAECYQMMRTFN